MKLKITRSSCYNDCETCGGMWGEGVVVTLDDKVILDVPCESGCFEGSHVEEDDILKALCSELNIELELD